jgi:hypothetical protein
VLSEKLTQTAKCSDFFEEHIIKIKNYRHRWCACYCFLICPFPGHPSFWFILCTQNLHRWNPWIFIQSFTE